MTDILTCTHTNYTLSHINDINVNLKPNTIIAWIPVFLSTIYKFYTSIKTQTPANMIPSTVKNLNFYPQPQELKAGPVYFCSR